MALQANCPELDFSILDGNRDQYFAAIQSGMDCNYEPMKELIRQVLHESENFE
jgi:cell filamentation protein